MALIPCNSWLFLLRIRAIPPHFRSKTTLVICTILWLLTFTSFLALPAFTIASHQTHDRTCEPGTTGYNHWLLFTPFIALIVFDTATIIAILAGFAMHSPDSSWIAKIKSVISVKHMGHLSGVFVRSGLIYYLYVAFYIINNLSNIHYRLLSELPSGFIFPWQSLYCLLLFQGPSLVRWASWPAYSITSWRAGCSDSWN